MILHVGMPGMVGTISMGGGVIVLVCLSDVLDFSLCLMWSVS